jgi:hypothetical protein
MNDLAGLSFLAILGTRGFGDRDRGFRVGYAPAPDAQRSHSASCSRPASPSTRNARQICSAPPSTAAARPPPSPADPGAGYRAGNFVFFVIGFATLLYALLRGAGPFYALIALGASAQRGSRIRSSACAYSSCSCAAESLGTTVHFTSRPPPG